MLAFCLTPLWSGENHISLNMKKHIGTLELSLSKHVVFTLKWSTPDVAIATPNRDGKIWAPAHLQHLRMWALTLACWCAEPSSIRNSCNPIAKQRWSHGMGMSHYNSKPLDWTPCEQSFIAAPMSKTPKTFYKFSITILQLQVALQVWRDNSYLHHAHTSCQKNTADVNAYKPSWSILALACHSTSGKFCGNCDDNNAM